ncbi:MAG TPA: cytochrome o ubiquinol oxidase subunit IV [Patescibacteria group bacterium]|nr:cytochrome o ubiquinol oxidase subunit IV [Patescibacteria group bacterium]
MNQKTVFKYVLGLLLSIFLTLLAYKLVVDQTFAGNKLIFAILTLALVQLVVQLIFFLHVGSEPRPHWNLAMFVSTVGLILIIVVGSLWIMANLNYNMTPQQIQDYITSQEGGF